MLQPVATRYVAIMVNSPRKTKGFQMSNVLDVPEVRAAAVRLTPAQYHRLYEMGVIPEKTELLSGIVVEKMPKSPLYTWMVIFLQKWLTSIVGSDLQVRKEDPLTLQDSEPEPDISVVLGTPDDFRLHHPSSAELVIEVALNSEAMDRQKAEIYAAASVQEYWIVLPSSRSIAVYRSPSAGLYRECSEHGIDSPPAPLFAPGSVIPASELFAG